MYIFLSLDSNVIEVGSFIIHTHITAFALDLRGKVILFCLKLYFIMNKSKLQLHVKNVIVC